MLTYLVCCLPYLECETYSGLPIYSMISHQQVVTLNTEFHCDPCPSGLAGDGRTCYDVNECLDKPCAMDCENTAGSFQYVSPI